MAKNENKEKAREMFEKLNMPLVKIAEALGVPSGSVRRWKSEEGWGGERSVKKTNARKEKNERSEEPKEPKRARRQQAKEIEIEPDEIPEGLNSKEYIFCLQYVKCFNATQAYLKACPNARRETASQLGYRMLRKVEVRNCINKLKHERMEDIMLTKADIFQKYVDIAFSDMTDYITFGQKEKPVMGAYGPVTVKDPKTGEKVQLTEMQNFIDLKDSADVDGRLITEIRTERGEVSVKLADRLKALQWLADHMDFATEEQKARLELLRAQTIKAKAQGGAEDVDDGVEIVFRGLTAEDESLTAEDESLTSGEEASIC